MAEESVLPLIASSLKGYVISPDYSVVAIIVVNFTIALILAPTSFGLITYLLFVLIFEILVAITHKGFKTPVSSPLVRLGYICAGLFGWLMGRFATRKMNPDPLIPEDAVGVTRAK